MNRVGERGQGESVWLGWFLAATIRSFAAVAERAAKTEFSARWLPRAGQLVDAIEASAWDGAWYLRAFDDLGRPWGSLSNDECKIDSLAQSWAVIAGGDPQRARIALDAAYERLVRIDDSIVRLLDPPFSQTPRDPGYIKAYPPGIRENGGQYSHAAAWLGIAWTIAGDGDRAKAIFDRINPITHSGTADAIARYRIEPYVVAADIAGGDAHAGRGGWSWYTGAAAWTWRLGVEHILGIKLIDGAIMLTPCLPSAWTGYSATLQGDGRIEITVERGGIFGLQIDGQASTGVIAFPGHGQVRQVLMTVPTPEVLPNHLAASRHQASIELDKPATPP